MNDPVYRPPQKLGDNLWQVPLIAGPLLFVLALVVAWIDARWVNQPFVTLGVMFPFWLVSAGITCKVIRAARCRNKPVTLALGFAAGCFAVYCTWVWFAIFADDDSQGGVFASLARFGSLFVRPDALWERARAIGAGIDRAVGPEGDPGNFVGFLRLIEAVLVIASCTFSQTFFFDRGRVYCEACEGWVREWKRFRFNPVQDDALIRRVEAGDFDAAMSHPPLEDLDAKRSVVMNVYVCPQCNTFATWNMNGVEEAELGDEAVSLARPPRGVMRVLAPVNLDRLRTAAPTLVAYPWLP